LLACTRALSPKGIYVAVSAPTGRWMIPVLARFFTALVLSRFVSQKLVLVQTRRSNQDLTLLRELITDGKVTPIIDRRYTLSEVPQAIGYLESGHARGKVVVSVGTA
jgi:NADPH:quinone reductase-like Zn-dependent oxidoreductase